MSSFRKPGYNNNAYNWKISQIQTEGENNTEMNCAFQRIRNVTHVVR